MYRHRRQILAFGGCELKAMPCCLFWCARKPCDDVLRTWPRYTWCFAPNFELPADAVSVACLAPHAELSSQPLNQRQSRNLLWFQQRIKFVDITRLAAFGSDVCLHQSQPFGHAELIPVRSALRAFCSRFTSGSRRLAASSATTSAKEFASMR